MAIKGCALALKKRGNHLITTAIEHHCVLNSFKWLKRMGFEVTILPVDKDFKVKLLDFENAISEETILASVMTVNNEVGAIEPIYDLSQIAKRKGILIHSDGVQAIGTEYINVKTLDVDFYSISAHKIYGPKGIGALYVKKGVHVIELISGGGQEKQMRAGTENVAGIVGFGLACKKLKKEKDKYRKHLIKLRNSFLKIVHKDNIIVNCEEDSVPGILSISIKDLSSETLLQLLSRKGILASMGSACNSDRLEASHVIQAGNVGKEYENGSLRFSFGKYNTIKEVEIAAKTLNMEIKRLREF